MNLKTVSLIAIVCIAFDWLFWTLLRFEVFTYDSFFVDFDIVATAVRLLSEGSLVLFLIVFYNKQK